MTRLCLRVAAVGALALAGCAESDQEPGSDVIADDQLYEVTAGVLESPDHGPQMCAGMEESYPPGCSGPEVVGWDWSAVEAESASGTTWGYYTLVGTWDGERFTPVEVREPDPEEPTQIEGFTSPCPVPEGGWRPTNPEKATDQALNEALARAATADDYAGAWVDQWYLDGMDPDDLEDEANDPTKLVLNLKFTGDLADQERWIREVWGGALCLSDARHTEAELNEIQERLIEEVPDVISTGSDVMSNTVTAQVYVATPELQADLDERYGEGTVVLEGWLQPVS